MRINRYVFAALCGALMLSTVFIGSSSFVSAQVATQAATQASTQAATQAVTPVAIACQVLDASVLDTAKGVCAKGDMNSACLVGSAAQVKMADSTGPAFEKPGDQIDISKLASLRTAVSDAQAGTSGVVMFKLQGGLPAT